MLPAPAEADRALRWLPLVEPMARQLMGRGDCSMDFDDLVQFGCVGLLEAARKFTGPREGFESYAKAGIRAAMLNGVRAANLKPRRLRRIERRLGGRAQKLEQCLGRAPTARELANANGLTSEAYHQVMHERYVRQPMRVDAALRKRRRAEPACACDPLQEILDSCAEDCLRTGVEALADRERIMLRLHFDENVKLKAIGARFGVSESRVSQILRRAAEKLRAGLV
jgi:RNA polymerase sigma factor for flagellar operon FliA